MKRFIIMSLVFFIFLFPKSFFAIDIDKKIKDFEKSLSSSPSEIENQARQILQTENLNSVQLIKINLIIGNCLWYQSKFNDAKIFYHNAEKRLNKIKDKRLIANVYNRLGVLYNDLSDYSKAIQYHQKALFIRKKLKDNSLIAGSYNNLGSVYYRMKNFEKALEYYLKSLDLREDSNQLIEIAMSYRNIAMIYKELGDFENSIKFMKKSLSLEKENNDKSRIAYVYNLLGNIYLAKKDYNSTIENYQQSLQLRLDVGNLNDIASSYNNLGLVYSEINDYKNALKYNQEALKIRTQLDNKFLIAQSYNNLGSICWNLHNYQQSLENYKKALEIRKNLNSEENKIISYINVGKAYIKLNKYKEAEESLNQAEILAEKNNSQLILNIYRHRITLLKQKKDFVKSCDLYEKLLQKTKEISSYQTGKQLAEMRTKYETEEIKKENELLSIQANIKDLKLKRQIEYRNFLLIIAFLAILIAVLFISKFITKNRLNNILNAQKIELENALKELKDKQDEIIELEKKNSIMAMVITANHELNQPLMTLKANMEMLEMFSRDQFTEKQLKYLTKINESLEQISIILEKMRNLKEINYENYAEDDEMIKL